MTTYTLDFSHVTKQDIGQYTDVVTELYWSLTGSDTINSTVYNYEYKGVIVIVPHPDTHDFSSFVEYDTITDHSAQFLEWFNQHVDEKSVRDLKTVIKKELQRKATAAESSTFDTVTTTVS